MNPFKQQSCLIFVFIFLLFFSFHFIFLFEFQNHWLFNLQATTQRNRLNVFIVFNFSFFYISSKWNLECFFFIFLSLCALFLFSCIPMLSSICSNLRLFQYWKENRKKHREKTPRMNCCIVTVWMSAVFLVFSPFYLVVFFMSDFTFNDINA